MDRLRERGKKFRKKSVFIVILQGKNGVRSSDRGFCIKYYAVYQNYGAPSTSAYVWKITKIAQDIQISPEEFEPTDDNNY